MTKQKHDTSTAAQSDFGSGNDEEPDVYFTQGQRNRGQQDRVRCLTDAMCAPPRLHGLNQLKIEERSEAVPISLGIPDSYKEIICQKMKESKFMLPILNI